MIDVKHLSKSFGDHLVLDDISEHIHPGEKVVVIGPSGSGKSTFLRCLNLLEIPTKGSITFDGTEITDPKVDIDRIRRQMGMVFQHFNLFPNMTIRKNITLAPVQTGLMKQAQADQRQDARPALRALPDHLEGYDTIYLGYPNYWGTMPMCVFTFLASFDFTGKTILPFCTHEGSGLGRSEADIRRLCPGARVGRGLAILGTAVCREEAALAAWVKGGK